MKPFAFLERRRRRRERAERIALTERQECERLSAVWREDHARRIAKWEAERDYRAAYPALRERFILAALTGLTAQPCVLTSESAWLGQMTVERAEAAMLAAGYLPPGESK